MVNFALQVNFSCQHKIDHCLEEIDSAANCRLTKLNGEFCFASEFSGQHNIDHCLEEIHSAAIHF